MNSDLKQVRATVYEALRKELSKPASKTKSTTYIEDFVVRMLNQAKTNPNSESARLLSKMIFTDDLMDKLDSEAERIIHRDKDFARYRLFKTLYDKQREVIYDEACSRKCIVCSRRAGKTELAARMLVYYCIEPNTPCLYLHTKMDNALSQCWPLILKAAEACELQMQKVDKQNARIDFINGSSIKLAANHDKGSAQMLRGGKYKLIIVDEAQSHRNMQELVDDVASPMLLDFPKSCLILQGTPPRIPGTYFEKAWNSGKWKNYHWTAKDNPFIQDFDEYVQSICESKQISMDNSLIQREYLGKFVFDTEAQVFANAKTHKVDPKLNVTDIVVGMDFGFADYNSTIGVAVDRNAKKGYVYFEWKANKQGVTEIIEAAKSCYDLGLDILRKNGVDPDGHIKMFGDTSDQSILLEMRKRHGMPTYNAYKMDRLQAIAKLSEQLRLGNYTIPEKGVLADEFLHIMYLRDDEDNITAEIDDSIYHPEAAMALLYASRYIEELFLAGDAKVVESYVPTTSVETATSKVVETQDIPDIMIAKSRKSSRRVSRF